MTGSSMSSTSASTSLTCGTGRNVLIRRRRGLVIVNACRRKNRNVFVVMHGRQRIKKKKNVFDVHRRQWIKKKKKNVMSVLYKSFVTGHLAGMVFRSAEFASDILVSNLSLLLKLKDALTNACIVLLLSRGPRLTFAITTLKRTTLVSSQTPS